MTTKTWRIHLDGKTFKLKVRHGYWSGKREIWLDEQLIAQGKQLLDAGSTHSFDIAGHHCELLILTNGMTFYFCLLVDGIPHLAEEDAGKGKKSNRLLKRILDTNTYWDDIARYADLKLSPVPNVQGLWAKRLIGAIRGYPVVLTYGVHIQSRREVISVWVRYSALSHADNLVERLRRDEEIRKLLEKVRPDEQFLGERGAWIAFPYRPKKESAIDVARRLKKLVALISHYAAPPDQRQCDSSRCISPQGDIHLAFVNMNLAFLCTACLSDSAMWSDQAKQAYHDGPTRLLQGGLACLGITIVGSLLWAALVTTLGRFSGIVSLIVLVANIKAMDKLKTKPTFISLLLATALASGSGFLALFWIEVWKLLRQASQPLQWREVGNLLRNAGMLVRESPLLNVAWALAILIAIYGLTSWPERRSRVKRALEVQIEDMGIMAELLHGGHSGAAATTPDPQNG